MGKRFVVSESEKKRIKGLYEQEDEPRGLELTPLAFTSMSVYNVAVRVKGDYVNDECNVSIKIDGDGNFIAAKIKDNFSDTVTDEEALNFVKELGRNGHFKKLPTFLAYDIDKGELSDLE